MRRELLAVAVWATLTLVPGTGAAGPVALGVNLLDNGDAETGDTTGWTTTTIEAFDDAGRIQNGTFFFWGGTAPVATATQEVDVTPLAATIAGGEVIATLSGRLGGFSTQADHASIVVTELDGTGAVVDTFQIGPVTDTERGNATQMLFRRTTDSLEPATRSLRVTLTATRLEGTNNDGSFDDLALVLADGPPAVPAGTNLLVNGDAETGVGSTATSGSRVPVAGWESNGSFTIVQYGIGGFPADAESARIGGGEDFFAGGPGSPVATASQTMDVSAAAEAIDGGRAEATIAAHIGGFSTQADNGTVAGIYRDGGGTELARQTLGPVTPADRGSQTRLEPRSATGDVPAGTRSIEVLLTATRSSGTANDGYFDNLSLSLAFDPPPQRTLTVTTAGSGTVTSVPAGISCGADCSESIAHGTSVTLTAVPAAGSVLGAWSGCPGAVGATCTVVLTADTTVGVSFAAVPPTTKAPSPVYDLSIELSTPHVVREGGVATNHLIVRNGSGEVATGIVVTSSGATLVGADSERATCDLPSATCTIGLLGPYDRADIGLTFRAPRRGDSVAHTVHVSGAQTELSLRNNVATGTTLVGPDREASLTFSNVVDGFFGGGNAKIEFVAEDGAVNDVTVTAADGGFVFRDAGVTIVPSGGCRAITPTEAWCPRGGDQPAETTIELGDGDDRLRENVVDLRPLVFGGAGDDTIQLVSGMAMGGTGDDALAGSPHGETFDGGLGVDSVDGGSGSDRLVFEDRPAANAVRVDLTARTVVGPGGEVESFSGIENVTGSPGADTIIGSAAVNRIAAGDGNDIVGGRGGDDVIDGGRGIDALQGDDGEDVVAGGFGDDALVAGGPGDDLLEGGIPGDPQRSDDLDDTGQDQLVGGDGDDVLSGGLGRDTLNGGNGSDTADYVGRSDGVDVDLSDGDAEGNEDDYGDPVGDGGIPPSRQGDALGSIENVIGTGHDDELSGDGVANRLYGRGGHDSLAGGGGSDQLHGELGRDTLAGGGGHDLLVGGADADLQDGGEGFDSASYSGRLTALTIALDSAANDGAPSEGDNVMPTVEHVVGGAGNDLLVGSPGADELDGGDGDDVLRGRAGADVLDGGDGADELIGDGGVDTADYSGRRVPVTVTLDGVANDGAEGERDNVVTENVRGGRGDDRLVGNGRANVLHGAAGDDVISGLGGADSLSGGEGSDELRGGPGADALFGGVGDDRIAGEAGNDSADGGPGGDTVLGGAGRDRMAGGGGGNDTVDAGGDAGDEEKRDAPPRSWNLGGAAKA